MNAEKELISQLDKHIPQMEKAFKHLRLSEEGQAFRELYNLAVAYYEDARHFCRKKKYVQAFEALMISWAYVDAGLRLDVFELLDDDLKAYFTIE